MGEVLSFGFNLACSIPVTERVARHVIGFRVLADPQGSNSGVRAEITPTAYPCLVARKDLNYTKNNTKDTRFILVRATIVV